MESETVSGVQYMPSVPTLNVLAFLDWEERMELSDICSSVSEEKSRQIPVPSKWFYERLLEESFVIAFPDASISELRYYVELRNSINSPTLIDSAYPRINSRSLVVTGGQWKPASTPLDYEMMLCGKSLKRFARVPVTLDINSGQVSLVRGERFSRTFRLDPICDKQVRVDAVEFMNGRNMCYVVTGCVGPSMDSACSELIDRLVTNMIILHKSRQQQLPSSTYKSRIRVSLSSLSRHGVRLIYTASEYLGSVCVEFEKARSIGGRHLCLEFELLHEFSKPIQGSHANKFIVCIPSSVDRTTRGLNLDTFALRKCLKAIKLNNSFIPCNESRLTRYLSLLSDHRIRIVAVVCNEDEEKTKASVAGLRFAELS